MLRGGGSRGIVAGAIALAIVLVSSACSNTPAPVTPQTTAAPATAAPVVEATVSVPSADTATASAPPSSTEVTPPATPEQEVRAVLDRWCAGVNAHSLDGKMSAYAERVAPFFGRSSATKAEIREVFASPFAKWKRMRQRIERVDIEVTGDRASAVLYKTWDYDGHAGWAEERIGFTRTPDGWRITSEQDIRASE